MSRKKWIGALVGIALLACGTEKLCAQVDINETCTFAATILIQNTNSTFNTNTTAFSTPLPTTLKFATKDLMTLCAKAEFNEGLWSSNGVPSGAKLIKFGTSQFTITFSVVDSKNNPLFDCSDIIFPGSFDDILAFTDKGTDNNTTAGSETDHGFIELDVDDLFAGGVTDLQLFGSFVNTIKTTAASKTTGAIINSQSFIVKALGGEGAIGNNDVPNCAITGSFSAKGSHTQ